MGKTTGFIEYKRDTHRYDKVEKRVKNFNEFLIPLSKEDLGKQGARCMDCGIPFCHSKSNGCPLGNIIPDFNHFVYQEDYKNAFLSLKSTNNFPDITGKICPAPCESACVLGINNSPVAIKSIELAIAEAGLKEGWDQPNIPKYRSHKTVAVIGSGPAGLACADQLNQAGHQVTVYERDDVLGGLMTYGIPNFKLEKEIIFCHVERMEKEGIEFVVNCHIGKDIFLADLKEKHDAVVIAVGSTVPRDLQVENRELDGIHFAISFLKQATQKVIGSKEFAKSPEINMKGKDVLVIGGGDTGSDCIGTSIRQGCKSVTQIEITAKPPADRDETMPWPLYDRIYRVSSSQEEGCTRYFSFLTKKILTENISGKEQVTGVEYVELEWSQDKKSFKELDTKTLKADAILLAMGFLGPDKVVATGTELSFDERGNVKTEQNEYSTSEAGVFTAGDARRGQSLVVWAISEGRECARVVDEYLIQGKSKLESKDHSFYEID